MFRAAPLLFSVLLLACLAPRAHAQLPVSPGGGNMIATLPSQPSATDQAPSQFRYFGSLSFVTARPWFLAVVPQFQRTAATRPVATGFIAFRERRAVGTR